MRVCVLLLLRLMVGRKTTHYIYVHPANHGQLSAILEFRAYHYLFHLKKHDTQVFFIAKYKCSHDPEVQYTQHWSNSTCQVAAAQ